MVDPQDPTQAPAGAEGEFARQMQEHSPGLLREFWDFLKHNKKWWLAPIVIVLLLIAVIIVLGSTAAAPFIYTLF